MKLKKHFFKKLLGFATIFFMVLFGVASVSATDLTSTNFIISNPIIGTGGGYGTSTNFKAFSSGNTVLSGASSSSSFITRYGFLYFSDPSAAQTITFDIDTSVADGETGTPYSVALGTVTTVDTRTSGSTDSINMIIAEGETSASGGMVVTVSNMNGANGLASTSVSADDIDSADGIMADGTENYGLCVITAGLIGFTIAAPYSGNTCATNSETNTIEGLTTTGEDILNSAGGSLIAGHAEISVSAAISPVTPAHTDYTDTLTFIATSTF